MPKRQIRLVGLLAASTIIATPFFASPAQAQATPDTLISVCSGVSLPRSVVTGIMDPVLTGIYGPIEANINQTLGALGALLGLPAPLSVDVNGLLTTAASGANIGVNVIAQDGSLVAPGDECNAQADSYTLDNPAGISIGGNAITGLGENGEEAQAGEIDSIAIGNRASTDAAALGSIALGTDASVGAGGTGSVALGTNSSVSVANSVALGAGSVASRGPVAGYVAFGLAGTHDSAGEVSVGAAGQERQITNVAPGSALTDAVNMAQLQAVASMIPINAVEYDDGTQAMVTLGGAAGTTITNLAAGALNATSTDAVNGSQLFATNQQVAINSLAISNLQLEINNGGAGPVQYSDPGTPTVPNGGLPTNDLTLVGADTGPVRLHNVAAGTATTDAVNVGQLAAAANSATTIANAYTDARIASLDFDLSEVRNDISKSRKESRAGSAAALAAAGMPQPMEAGKTMIAAGVGTYRGRSAIALGASHAPDNGKSVFKLGVTYDSSEHVGANAGVGFQF